ncbi:MAG TPA: TetR/AcrR family transcriptional regulator [Puia sp.]|jgi:AcrR family transcriptional regulator|nr:TetR/AcrR family transcriptional regulator [Puia sp.]
MDNKERILMKAADLFCRYGIRTITMDEIASQLGISKKTIYQFFTDKDDMVSAVIEQEIQRNEMECGNFREAASDAVHQIFLALQSLEEMLKYTNPLMLYDLEKHHPASFQKLREYKYRFLYQVILENLEWGVSTDLYRPDIDKDIVAKARIEAAFLVFNPDVFPHSRYRISEVNFELAMLFLHGVATDKGKQLIESYTAERNQKLSYEQKA